MRHGEGQRSGARGLVSRHWGRQLRIGVGNLSTPMGGSLPQQGTGRARARQVAYPNGRFPAPMEERTRAGAPSCLPQWEVTCPNRAMHATAALDLDAFLLRGSEPRCHERLSCWERIRIGVFPYRPSPGRRRGPKCVWVSLFSEDPARGWSKMRLSSTVLAGFMRFQADSDAFWTTHPERPRFHPRLRRILDHAPRKTPVPPETQTHFGPPSSSTTGPPVRASRLQSLTRATVPEDHGHRAAGRLAATTCPPTPQKSRTAPQPRTRRAFPLPSLSRHRR